MVQTKISSKKGEFFLRSLSSIILIPIISWMILLGGFYFISMVIILSILLSFEWADITEKNSFKWKIFGIFYIGIPCVSLVWLGMQNNGIGIVLSIFSLVLATNIGGYIFGKTIGGWKMAPKISPNKTWSGVAGGIFLAIIVGLYREELFYFTIIVSILAQIGDLLESWIKRKCCVKDSGNMIPGHGGFLDEFDGIVLVAPFIALATIVAG